MGSFCSSPWSIFRLFASWVSSVFVLLSTDCRLYLVSQSLQKHGQERAATYWYSFLPKFRFLFFPLLRSPIVAPELSAVRAVVKRHSVKISGCIEGLLAKMEVWHRKPGTRVAL